MKTTVIVNATVYDGTGAPPMHADVVLEDGVISHVLHPETASTGNAQVFPAEGLCLAPGFIDIHGHSDTTLIKAPTAEAKISQGITTEVTGNCGCSKCIEVMPEWDNVLDYAKALRSAQPAINSATMAGHNSLRERIIGYEDRWATRQEMRQMKDILTQALEDGACGFSGGLWYLPGKYAPTWEMLELAEALKGTGKPYANHMRSEGDGLLEALEEAIQIARAGDNKLQVSHLKAAPQRNWDKIFHVFQRIEDEKSQGLQVFADRYPFTYSCTGLRQILPRPWNRIKDLKDCFNNPEQAQQAASILDDTHTPEEDWQKIILLDDIPELIRNAAGKTLWDLSQKLRLTPGQTVIAMLRLGTPSAAFGKMSTRNMKLIIGKPWVFPCTDASAVPFDGSLGQAHPRAFASIPNFYRIARENESPEAVIRRMTSMPANFFNLPDRGLIKPGYAADLVLFDELTFRGQATYADPHLPTTGIKAVFVNGRLAYDGITHQVLERAGAFLSIPNAPTTPTHP